NHKSLVVTEIVEGLRAWQCPDTGGVWIPARAYGIWVQAQLERLDHLPQSENVEEPSDDDFSVKLCPESGTLMFPYRVGHGFNFRIDRSVTGGIWLDGGEWEQLKKRNYHDELNLVFAAPWQREERIAQLNEVIEQSFRAKLGDELYEKISVLHEELADHPHRSEALALAAPWQREERIIQLKAVIEQSFRAKLGDELYEKLSALHEELANHPNRSEALSLLMHNAAVE
ncbi:MAG: hypothetical protein GXP30_04275, partial [Verrucomicrobia bacterium]|nr:hypothetical protein [Verrucomicrobiota bacterium]